MNNEEATKLLKEIERIGEEIERLKKLNKLHHDSLNRADKEFRSIWERNKTQQAEIERLKTELKACDEDCRTCPEAKKDEIERLTMSNEMPYAIVSMDSDGETVIAKFANDSDRDLCMDALQEEYSDCVFRAKDNPGE